MNEEVVRPQNDMVPLIGALYAACDMFLMDDTCMLRKGRRFGGMATTSAANSSNDEPSSLLSTILAMKEEEERSEISPEESGKARKKASAEGEALLVFRDNQFRLHFRMNVDTFEMLCSDLAQHVKENPSRGRKPLPLDRKVLMCLWFLGSQGESIRTIAKKFDVCESSASVILDSIIKALNNLKTVVIQWPAPDNITINEIVQGFFNISAFPNVLGIMATTHIPILTPKDHPEVFVNRKKSHTIVLQTICDHTMKFMDCYTGWPGSVHDSVVLCESDIFREIENNFVYYFPEEDVHLLGVVAYPLKKWLVTPYLEDENYPLFPSHQEYNHRLLETRLVAQNAFTLLRGRWKRLKFVGMTRTALIPNVIMACCVLHNFCLSHEEEFKDFVNGEPLPDEDGFPSPTTSYPDDEAGKLKREAITAYINNN